MKLEKLKQINRNLKANLTSIPNISGRNRVSRHIKLIDEFLEGKFKIDEYEQNEDKLILNKWFQDRCILYSR